VLEIRCIQPRVNGGEVMLRVRVRVRVRARVRVRVRVRVSLGYGFDLGSTEGGFRFEG